MSSKSGLALHIEYQGHGADFVLTPNTPFVVGRAAEADLQINADSISTKHLELLWDGSVLRVRDLESSNGSFRMPQDGPFLEAHFGPQDRELHLRLAKIPVTISWKDTAAVSDKTEVIDFKKTEVMDFSPIEEALPPPKSAPKTTPAAASLSSKELGKSSENKAQSATPSKAIPWAYPVFLAGVFVCAFQNFYFFSQHASLLNANRGAWSLGPAIDLYIFWNSDLKIFSAVWILGIVVAYLAKQRLAAYRPSALVSRVLVATGLALMLVIFSWPVVFLKASGNPELTRNALGEFYELNKNVQSHDFASKEMNLAFSSKLTDLSGPLKGSSIFYAFWHNFQKKRVVDECGGVGEGTWEKKRLCLVLLYALSLDGYTSIRPIYLGPTAASLIFLSSLDGVIRVLAAEGSNSDNLRLFISTLDDVGLQKEAQEFVTLVQGFKGQSFDELMKALLELRLSVEKKVFEAQARAGLPPDLKLNLMGPLEMGI